MGAIGLTGKANRAHGALLQGFGGLVAGSVSIAPMGRSYAHARDSPTRFDGLRRYRALRVAITLAGWKASASFHVRATQHCVVDARRFRATPTT